MRDEGFIYVAAHQFLNRRCTNLPGCIRLRNDYIVSGGANSTHSLTELQSVTALWSVLNYTA